MNEAANVNQVKNCQSFIMPLKNDDREGKSGLDARYCSYCFAGGDFTSIGMSASEFRDRTYEILTKQSWIKPVAWISTRPIPKLPRWKQENPDQI